jgi:predicted dehydrogenase
LNSLSHRSGTINYRDSVPFSGVIINGSLRQSIKFEPRAKTRSRAIRGRWKMKVGIVGTGGIAKVHARAIQHLGGEIVGVCGSSISSAEAFGHARPYSDLKTMLAEVKPEVVHICTPNHLHKAQAIAAFDAGAHVLCEKPIAASIEDAELMIEAAARSGRVGAVMYHNRGYPLVQLMRDRIASGEVGRLLRVGGCYMNDEGLSPERFTWHFVSKQVGGSFAMMDIGVHWLDLVEHVTGRSIREMTAQFSTHHPKRTWTGQPGQGPRPEGRPVANGIEVDVTVEDHAEIMVRFDDGASGTATISTTSAGYPNRLSISVDGTNLGLDWTQQEPDWYLERRSEGLLKRFRSPTDLSAAKSHMTFLPAGHAEGHSEAFRNVIAEAWRGMQGKPAEFPTFADGLRGLRLVEAAIRSAAEKRTVAVSARSA